ncbi:MAG: alkaline phosphatase [Bacteroidales bacterium]|nr:alkaline phosphatase [Bacteroidales bacterium]
MIIKTKAFFRSFLLAIFINNFSFFAAIGQTSLEPDQKKAKYIFLFIGDGMGISQSIISDIYLKSIYKTDTSLFFTCFPVCGLTSTTCVDSYITDSGAAGTALACGQKTMTGVIGMDSTKTIKLRSIADKLKEKNYKIGIVSNVSLNHATPAVFYAHQPSRNNYNEIAIEMAESKVDYFGGGGIKVYSDSLINLERIYEIFNKNDFNIINDKEIFENWKSEDGKLYAINPILSSGESTPYVIDDSKESISLADFTQKGIELLDNENGFFMMVEGGKIDWACHSNDAATVITETLAFNEAIGQALEFYKSHPDETLIIVTADHETGGLSVGWSGTHYSVYYNLLRHQNISYDEFSDKINTYIGNHTIQNASIDHLLPLINEHFGLIYLPEEILDSLSSIENPKSVNLVETLRLSLSSKEMDMLNKALYDSFIKDNDSYSILYGGEYPLAVTTIKIFNNKSGVGWTTFSHTGIPVATYAKGINAGLFSGCYENSDIPKKIFESTEVLNK